MEKGESYSMWGGRGGRTRADHRDQSSMILEEHHLSFAPRSRSRPPLICAQRSLSEVRQEDRVSRASLLLKCWEVLGWISNTISKTLSADVRIMATQRRNFTPQPDGLLSCSEVMGARRDWLRCISAGGGCRGPHSAQFVLGVVRLGEYVLRRNFNMMHDVAFEQ